MKKMSLMVERRSQTGKGPARRLRAKGKAPAVFYGKNIEPMKLSVDVHELAKVMEASGRNTLFDLEVQEDGSTVRHVAVLKERQVRPLDGALIHVDFIEVSMTEPIQVTVQLEFSGKTIGVEKGGVLQISARELLVSCLPSDIPGLVEVDVTDLEVGRSIHVNQIKFPDGVTPVHEDDYVVVSVVPPKRADAEGAEEAPEAAGAEAAEGATNK
ncbi:MAG: 50S ribosomal protein L25 [Pseudomonadota bacterium]